jgi:D-tyrosyl-tRNA(Tyr) deacylase
MRAVVQRVAHARVEVDSRVVGEIGRGLVVLVAVGKGDTEAEALALASKIANLRVFADDQGRMNRSALDTAGAVLAISQFTLYGDTTRGRRPSFEKAADPDLARQLYERFVGACREIGLETQAGVFQAHMDVHLLNDGPVTLICDVDPK